MQIVDYKEIHRNKNIKQKITNFLFEIIIEEYKFNDLNNCLLEQDFDIFLKPNNNLLLLMNKNEIIGLCSVIDIDDKTGKINAFFVKKEFRRKGYGKLLLVKQEFFIANCFEEVILCENAAFGTLSFFKNSGFIPYRFELNEEIWCGKRYRGQT